MNKGYKMGNDKTALVVMTNGDKYVVKESDLEDLWGNKESFWEVRDAKSGNILMVSIKEISTVVLGGRDEQR